MVLNRLNWRAGGEAGDGIMTVGDMFARACTRGGLQVAAYTEFPSLVRGGHNNYWLHIEDRPVYSTTLRTDLLVALNRQTVDLHKDTLAKGSAVIYDPDSFTIAEGELGPGILLAPIPLMKLATEQAGNRIYRNTVAVGASVGMVDYDFAFLESVIAGSFAKKGQKVIDENVKAARLGYDAAKGLRKDFGHHLRPVEGQPKRMILTGSDAITLGAIKAGCKLYSTYPMTPSSEILHQMAYFEMEHNIVVRQTEDEIAGIVMALGAAHAGVRAMTGTAGGGFALMAEGLSLAAQSETPVVIAVIQRPAPSTGMPTWTAQGDLSFVASAGHGEIPRILVAPGDMEEAFAETHRAFNLAEKYQLPALILSDKYLCMSWWSQPFFDTSKLKVERGKLLTDAEIAKMVDLNGRRLRYLVTDDGVSPRWFPGQPRGGFTASGNEHNEAGDVCETIENRIAQMNKRWRKLDTAMKRDIPAPRLYGPADAELTIIGWGSTKMPVLEAMRILHEERNVSVNYLHMLYILPFPTEEVERVLGSAKRTLLIEGNYDGQLGALIARFTGRKADALFLKYDGRPFYPEEVVERAIAALEEGAAGQGASSAKKRGRPRKASPASLPASPSDGGGA